MISSASDVQGVTTPSRDSFSARLLVWSPVNILFLLLILEPQSLLSAFEFLEHLNEQLEDLPSSVCSSADLGLQRGAEVVQVSVGEIEERRRSHVDSIGPSCRSVSEELIHSSWDELSLERTLATHGWSGSKGRRYWIKIKFIGPNRPH